MTLITIAVAVAGDGDGDGVFMTCHAVRHSRDIAFHKAAFNMFLASAYYLARPTFRGFQYEADILGHLGTINKSVRRGQ